MLRRTPEQVAILLAVLLGRAPKWRVIINREQIRQLGGRKEAPESWYDEINQELREHDAVMFPFGEKFAIYSTVNTHNCHKIPAYAVDKVLENVSYSEYLREIQLGKQSKGSDT
jgi:hypothetical protein